MKEIGTPIYIPNQDREEMSPALKELSKKSYLIIKHKLLPKQYQIESGRPLRDATKENSKDYFENRVSSSMYHNHRIGCCT